MISNIGNFLLFLNIFFCFFIVYQSFRCLKTSSNSIFKSIYQVSLLQSTTIIICFFTLVAGFLISDFSVINVYQNSTHLSPFFIKLPVRGTMKEFVTLGNYLNNFFILFLISNKNQQKNYRIYTLIIQNLLILGFLFFILFNSNPFSAISPTLKKG